MNRFTARMCWICLQEVLTLGVKVSPPEISTRGTARVQVEPCVAPDNAADIDVSEIVSIFTYRCFKNLSWDSKSLNLEQSELELLERPNEKLDLLPTVVVQGACIQTQIQL